jgi:hypothetical protein
VPTRQESKQLQDAALAWVEANWGKDRKCPLCGNEDWGISEPVSLEPYSEFLRGRMVLIPVTCTRCARSELLNVIQAKLLPGIEP